jgi:putative Mg2+ transporter-C (MgtC) family protein
MAFSAALVTVTGLHLMTVHGSSPNADQPLRILQALAQALGFLAAGAIIRAGDVPQGLTTAVNLWIAGAIGISCGSGMYLIAGVSTLVTLVVIEALPMVERAVPTPSIRRRRDPPEGHS